MLKMMVLATRVEARAEGVRMASGVGFNEESVIRESDDFTVFENTV